MKFMKLGTKPDTFKTGKDNIRYVVTELDTDFEVVVGEITFNLHKFPLLSKSTKMQKLAAASDTDINSVDVSDIPGGASAFEICVKFCYGMVVTVNAYNVVAARCAAEYLQMHDALEKGNLISKLDVFINSSIFRSWKDSIIVLQSTRTLNAVAEELKLISRCLDCIAEKACIDTSKVDWSYTYNLTKLPAERSWNHRRHHQAVPSDWWVEDLCDLNVEVYRRVLTRIKSNGGVSPEVIGKALVAYTARRLPGSGAEVQASDSGWWKKFMEVVVWLLPNETGSVPCEILVKLLRTSIVVECGEGERKELMKRIWQQLSDATVSDLLIPTYPPGSSPMYDIPSTLVKEFARNDHSDTCSAAVAKLVDGYLAEVSKDPNLHVSMFVDLYEATSSFPRRYHDGLYCAIDVFLKEHRGIEKSEKKRLCRLMDCRKLSANACAHAVQNDRLPLRVAVQILFFQQVRSASVSDTKYADMSGSLKGNGSSRTTTTNTDEEWESTEEKALKTRSSVGTKKRLMKLWSAKSLSSDVGSSDTSSPVCLSADVVKPA